MLCQRGGQICKPSRLCCFPRLRIAALLFACSPCHVGSLVPAAIQMPSNGSAETPPALSVILPVYNAMPWLPLAVRDILKQDLHGAPLELICANDSSSDGSLAFLDELVALLGPRASREECLLPQMMRTHTWLSDNVWMMMAYLQGLQAARQQTRRFARR